MLPIKQLLVTFAPELPMETTLLAVVTLVPAPSPRAVLPWPEVLKPSAPEPMAVLPLPVMLATSALSPLAVLSTPVVLAASAPRPVAVFSTPMVLLKSAPVPRAVFWPPVVLLSSAKKPTAVLNSPVLRVNRALCPSAVLPVGYPPSGGGLTACAAGETAKQARASGMRRRPIREGDRTVDVLKCRVVIFFVSFLLLRLDC